MVAVVIMTVGLLALASLQLSLMRTSGQTKAQSTALALAKQQIETLRAFTDYDEYANDIVNSGPTDVTIGGYTYSMTTTVERWVFDAAAPIFTKYPTTNASLAALRADTSIDYVTGRDFKKVNVKVTWSDANGAAAAGSNTIELDDVVDWLDPSDAGSLAKKTSGATARSVEVVIKDPGAEAGVIPIAIGDTSDTAATNPKPVVNSSGTETRFDIQTYSALSGNLALAQSRVETAVISCSCDTSTKPTDSTARGYRPTYFNGVRYVAPTLTTYVPPAGQKASAVNSESPYCYDCCRDHNDPASIIAAKKPRFDPWRAEHIHYYLDNANTLQEVTNAKTTYLESCRLIRVDGIFRVAADFNDEYFNLLRTKNDGSTTAYVPTDAAATNYEDFVLAYLDQRVITPSDASTDPTVSAYNHTLAASAVTTLETAHSINDPASITLQRTNDYKWLHSRGLYVDYLEAEALAAIEDAKSDCEDISCSDEDKAVAVLRVLPFTSINLTELSNWTPTVADTGYVSVTGGSFFALAGSSDDPVRGKVVPHTSNLPTTASTADAIVKIRKSNSGLAVMATPIDKDEDGLDGSGNPITTEDDKDTQAFDIPDGASSPQTGTFTVNLNNYDFAVFPALSGTNITNCTYAKVSGKYVYTCQSAGLGVPTTLLVTKYNYQSASASKGKDRVLTCTKADGTGAVSYTTTNSDEKIYTCNNYTVGSASSSAGGVTTSNFVTLKDTLLDESQSVDFSTVGNGDTLTLDFSAGTPTYGYTCIYTTSISDKVITAANCK
jgi:Tfp pilus assembly protein PilV